MSQVTGFTRPNTGRMRASAYSHLRLCLKLKLIYFIIIIIHVPVIFGLVGSNKIFTKIIIGIIGASFVKYAGMHPSSTTAYPAQG